MHISLLLHLRDVKARPEIILRALYAQRYVYRNTLILHTVHRNFKSNAPAARRRLHVRGGRVYVSAQRRGKPELTAY